MKKESWQLRIQILGAFFIILLAILGYRLFQKQILQHSAYMAKAENQYMVEENITATRGKIYFSDMFPAATNTRTYQVIIAPKQVKDKQITSEKLSSLLEATTSDIYEKINVDKYYIPPIKKGLSEETGKQIADLKLNGVVVMPESVRIYPEGQLASQTLGFVDSSGNGHYGVEGYYNNELKGVGGVATGEKSASGEVYDINSQINPQNGIDVILTINRDIQYKVEQILADSVKKYQADSGSVVIQNPKTGEILAMANFPSYDANNFSKVTDQALFNNAAINNAWEPGSVFKPITMAAAINDDKVQPDTTNVFGSEVTVNSYQIHTSTNKAYGKETMTQVLENSDNVAMVWVAQLLGKDAMYKYFKNFGFGRKTGIELDTESPGDLAEVKKTSDVQQANMAFGQGITATPLQVVSAISTIANKGKLMQPYIVSKTIDTNGKEDVRKSKEVGQIVTEDTAKKVTDMLISVVVNGHGKHAAVEGYQVAGKTGTAQVPKPGGGYYDDRHVGSFAGYVPADNPAFSMIVRLDNPRNVDWAESSAAPAFSEIATWLLSYMGIPKT
jgi:cell division protein FtsI/penicillin-binding protein 2